MLAAAKKNHTRDVQEFYSKIQSAPVRVDDLIHLQILLVNTHRNHQNDLSTTILHFFACPLAHKYRASSVVEMRHYETNHHLSSHPLTDSSVQRLLTPDADSPMPSTTTIHHMKFREYRPCHYFQEYFLPTNQSYRKYLLRGQQLFYLRAPR